MELPHAPELERWEYRPNIYLVRQFCVRCQTRRWMRQGKKATTCLFCLDFKKEVD